VVWTRFLSERPAASTKLYGLGLGGHQLVAQPRTGALGKPARALFIPGFWLGCWTEARGAGQTWQERRGAWSLHFGAQPTGCVTQAHPWKIASFFLIDPFRQTGGVQATATERRSLAQAIPTLVGEKTDFLPQPTSRRWLETADR